MWGEVQGCRRWSCWGGGKRHWDPRGQPPEEYRTSCSHQSPVSCNDNDTSAEQSPRKKTPSPTVHKNCRALRLPPLSPSCTIAVSRKYVLLLSYLQLDRETQFPNFCPWRNLYNTRAKPSLTRIHNCMSATPKHLKTSLEACSSGQKHFRFHSPASPVECDCAGGGPQTSAEQLCLMQHYLAARLPTAENSGRCACAAVMHPSSSCVLCCAACTVFDWCRAHRKWDPVGTALLFGQPFCNYASSYTVVYSSFFHTCPNQVAEPATPHATAAV